MRLRNYLAAGLALAALAASASLHAGDETHYGHDARWRHAAPLAWPLLQRAIWCAMALVVPPTAELQTDYAYGSVSSRMTRINHQFQRPWPNGYWTPYGFLPASNWPNDTRNFGTYYIRGPW